MAEPFKLLSTLLFRWFLLPQDTLILLPLWLVGRESRLGKANKDSTPELTAGFHSEVCVFMRRLVKCSVLFAVFSVAFLRTNASAVVKLHSLFTDNMVLQQGMRVPIWGEADAGEKVTVEFLGQKVSAMPQDGRWKLSLAPLSAGGPYVMKVTGSNTLELKNVMVGEVWFASGQSNMAMALKSCGAYAENTISNAGKDDLRLYTVPRRTSPTPLLEAGGSWLVSSPETAQDFSAVAYWCGRYLKRALRVPVGLIDCSVGGSSAQAWMSREMFEPDARLKSIFLDRDHSKTGDIHKPMFLYNGMVASVIPYAIRGAIWYQGESNCGAAYLYRDLFPALITGWRKQWGDGQFPFLFVQLAPYQADKRPELGDSYWAELREAQLLTLGKVPNSGMAVITDAGDLTDIHPKNKQPVGERLAKLALDRAYAKRVACESPRYDSMQVKGNRIELKFRYAYGKLKSDGSALTGFSIAGEDRQFVWADARITGKDTVEVSSASVAKPVAVRFGWSNFPQLNLFNSVGLPASPFRTDDWPVLSQEKT